MTGAEAVHSRLVLSPRIAVESIEEDAVVVFHSDTSSRLRLTRPLYEVLRRFSEPATAAELTGGDPSPALLRSITTLQDKGYLVPEGAGTGAPPARRLATSTYTLFQCPRRRPGAQATDVAVLGVPSDLGVRGWPGSRAAPEEIRKRSYDYTYRVSVDDGEPLGWFDVARRQRILSGVSFADWGDVWFRYGESLAAVHERIEAVCQEMVDAGSFPLLIGGDQSLAYAPVSVLQRAGPLSVVYLDAHTDFDHTPPGAALNNYSVARGIHALPNVAKLVQAGHRGYTANDKVSRTRDDLEIVTLAELVRGGPRALVDAVPAEHPVYVSLDINVVDPAYAPAATNPAPGGLTLDALKDLLTTLGAERRVVGFDLCEVNPSRDMGSITTMSACHLLLAGLGAFLSPGDGSPDSGTES
jgi:agmatinase